MISYTVQPEWKVLVLEDAPERIVWFKERVPDAVYVAPAEDAIRALSSQTFRVIFLDHDLHWMHAADNAIVKGTGKEVAMHLKRTGFRGIVVIHSKNEDGARVMLKILPRAKVARFGEFDIRVSSGKCPKCGSRNPKKPSQKCWHNPDAFHGVK